MALTAAQYKAKFDTAIQNAENTVNVDAFNTQSEVKVAWAQIAAVWEFLWFEKAMFDKRGLVPSAAANAYAAKAESNLAKAETDATGFSASSNSPKAVGWAQMASDYAYAFAELTKVEAP